MVPFVLTNKDGKNITLKFQQLSYPKSTSAAKQASGSDLSLAKTLIGK